MNYTIENPFDFKAARDWNPELVAASTSKLCRFTGRCEFFYSVAQHMQLAAHIAGRIINRRFDVEKQNTDPSDWYAKRYKRAERFFRVVMMSHLHDSLEHLTGDIITPVKSLLMFNPEKSIPHFKTLSQWEYTNLLDVYKHHGIDPTLFELDIVTTADRYALSYEVMKMMDWEHPRWQTHLKDYPVTMFDQIQISRTSPDFDERSWLEDYYQLVERLKKGDTVVL